MSDTRQDGYSDIIASLMSPVRLNLLATSMWVDVDDLYNRSGLAATIVNRPAEDALARGFTVTDDDELTVQNEFDRLGGSFAFVDALRWSRLYGGGAILVIAEDGGTLGDPLAIDRLERIVELQVYPVTRIAAGEQVFTDPNAPNYGEPIYYMLTNKQGGRFPVHTSRLIPVPGDPIADAEFQGRVVPWQGRSVLRGCAASLQRYRESLQWMMAILKRKQQGVYKMQGLAGMFLQKQEAIVRKRLDLVDSARNILNTVAVDVEDDYTVLNLGLDGVKDAVGEAKADVAANAAMPQSIVFGESAAGLNPNEDADLQGYYSRVAQDQNRKLRPGLEMLITLIWAQREFRGKAPESWHVEFNALWLPSDKENAETDKTKAEARQATLVSVTDLLDRQLISPEEARAFIRKFWAELDLKTDEPPEFEEGDEVVDPVNPGPPVSRE